MTTAFPDRLKHLRTVRGLSQPQLAEATTISQSAISRWELGGSDPTLSGIRRLAEFFQVSADYLIGLADTPQPIQPGHFLVDLDAVDAIKSKKGIGRGQTWYAVVPSRYLICTPQQYAEIDRTLPPRWRRWKE